MLGSMPIASNNSAIEIADIGEGDSVQGGGLKCVTDHPSCCVTSSTPLGEWISPNGTAVPGNDSGADIYIDRGMGFIRLNRRNNATSPTGLYCGVLLWMVEGWRHSVLISQVRCHPFNVLCHIFLSVFSQ